MEKKKIKKLLYDFEVSEEIVGDFLLQVKDDVDTLKKDIKAKTFKGDAGKDGIDGVDGLNGKDGKDGIDGIDGAKGEKGDRGEDGTSVELKDVVDTLQPIILSRIPHGGNMNRKETFAGVDRLTRYTDINWKPGNNVTFNISNNDTTKMVDVTIVASGGGGGGGITRLIQSISTSQAADSAAATDYVYLCSGTMTLTMPDATSGNTNLYTIKNVGTGTVTVATTGGQTIDGSATASLPVRYTSIDLESDTANWNVT